MNKYIPLGLFSKTTASQAANRGLALAMAITVATGYLTCHTFVEPLSRFHNFLAGLSLGVLWVCALLAWDAVNFKKSKADRVD